MNLICVILIAINAGGVPVVTKTDVAGKVLSETGYKYLVDFTEGVKRFDPIKGSAYSEVLVDKDQCVRLK